jgi:hypothetical protein
MSITSSAAAQQVIADRMSAALQGWRLQRIRLSMALSMGPALLRLCVFMAFDGMKPLSPVCIGRTASSILGYLSLSKEKEEVQSLEWPSMLSETTGNETVLQGVCRDGTTDHPNGDV